MSLICALFGFILGQLPLIITVILCIILKFYNFFFIFVIYTILEAINDAIMKQTKSWIISFKPILSTRNNVEHDIVNGCATFKKRLFLFFHTLLNNMIDCKHYIVCAFIALVIAGIFKFFS